MGQITVLVSQIAGLCQFLAVGDYYSDEHQVQVTATFFFGVPGLDDKLVGVISCWKNGIGEVSIALGMPLQNCPEVPFPPGIL